jgi:hypothetical protein
MGRVIEPRKVKQVVVADGVTLPEGSTVPTARTRSVRPTGVCERSTRAKGSPGTWEILSSPRNETVWGCREPAPGPEAQYSVPMGSERESATRYRRAKETK